MPYLISAHVERHAWVELQPPRHGMPQEEFAEYILAVGAGNATGMPWFKQSNRSRRFGPMLWTGGPDKLVSTRMLAAMESCGATGYRTFPVRITGQDGSVVTGYRGLIAIGGLADDVRTLDHGEQVFAFIGSDRLMDALVLAGITDIDAVPQ